MKKILFVTLGIVALTACSSYHPPIDPQFSCANNSSRTKVTLTGNDPRHTAVGYCRGQMQVKNWGYYYDGLHYMTIKFRENEEVKTSCLTDNSRWASSTAAECRAKHGH
ncbi:MAG: membrane lipoprotein lipid attachment site-containing protein [Fibrobacter sp.]|nr:membrane lipoprotein lipid attachment site-containing protein [Fibrobacter sp.]